MEVFKVFATFSLQDLISDKLGSIGTSMRGLDGQVRSLSDRMGALATAMVPVMAAAAILLGSFGLSAGKAMAFESAMADVGKVLNGTSAEVATLGEDILDMSGRIPMAADGIAAIIASAAQSGVAKDNLRDFAEQAAKMGVAFDLTGDQAGKMMSDWRSGMGLSLPRTYALADAVNHLSNNMNATAPALGEVVQRVGSVAMQAGLAEQQVAALGAAFLSAGASPEVAATALEKFSSTLVLGSAMSKRAQEAFAGLGFSAVQMARDMHTDAQGTIFKVLQALADKPKELQVSLLTQMFGEEALGAIAPLLGNMKNLSQAFDLVGDSAQYAGSMEAEFQARSATTENALILMRNKFSALAVAVGNAFLPAIAATATFVGDLAAGLRTVAKSPFGQWLLKTSAALSLAVLAVGAFAAALWAAGAAPAFLAAALAPLKAALLGLSWPIWAVIAAAGLLYVAFRVNLGGIADVAQRWVRTIGLVARGTVAALTSMQNGVGEIRGELAKEIKAAGLVGLVTTVVRFVRRLSAVARGTVAVFRELGNTLAAAVAPALDILGSLLGWGVELMAALGIVTAKAANAAGLGTWEKVGRALGVVVAVVGTGLIAVKTWGLVLGVVAVAVKIWTVAQWLLNASLLGFPLTWIVGAVVAVAGLAYLIVRNWSTIRTFFANLWGRIVSGFTSALASIRATWQQFTGWLTGLGSRMLAAGGALIQGLMQGIGGAAATLLVSGLQGIGAMITDIFSGISLFESGRRLLATLGDGVRAAKDELVGSVTSALAQVRELLPFSDAHTGPLSNLTGSGMALMQTLGAGAQAGAGDLITTVSSIFGRLTGLFAIDEGGAPAVGGIPAPGQAAAAGTRSAASQRNRDGAARAVTIHINNLTLPQVQDSRSFLAALQELAAGYDGSAA